MHHGIPHAPPPPPPSHLNGWGHYTTGAIQHLLVRVHYIEQTISDMREDARDQRAAASARTAAAPATPPDPSPSPSTIRDTVKEVGSTAKEIGAALRWMAVILITVMLVTKRIDPTFVREFLGRA